MQAALDSLREAQVHLMNASPDKGGFRKAALIDVERAIKNVEQGIRFDNQNPSSGDRLAPYIWRNR